MEAGGRKELGAGRVIIEEKNCFLKMGNFGNSSGDEACDLFGRLRFSPRTQIRTSGMRADDRKELLKRTFSTILPIQGNTFALPS